MSRGLREAAERWRSLGRDAECGVSDGWDADAMMLVDAYLAEHPADDGEPVTEEWLRSVGFTVGAFHVATLGLVLLDMRGEDWECFIGDDDDIALDFPATRGHVRRLCAALGIPLLPLGR